MQNTSRYLKKKKIANQVSFERIAPGNQKYSPWVLQGVLIVVAFKKKKKKSGEKRILPTKNTATGVQMGLMVSFYSFTFYSPSLPQRSVLFNRISHRHRCLLVLAEICGFFGISVTQPRGREQARAVGRPGNEGVLSLTAALSMRLHSQ